MGDYFLCGNKGRRDYWLGILTANGGGGETARLQSGTYFTLPDRHRGGGHPYRREPVHTDGLCPRPLLRGIHPIIPDDAKIVLWGGGIWNWLGPADPDQCLALGTREHPPGPPGFPGGAPSQSRGAGPPDGVQGASAGGGSRSEDKTILFIEWLEYEAREALLLEANIGVLLQPVHLETRYSIRRHGVMDCIWAELPLLISHGDITSEWVDQHHLGKTVPAGQTDQTAQAICELLLQPKASFSDGFKLLKEQYRWSQVVQPLVNFCLNGSKTASAYKLDARPDLWGARPSGARYRLARGRQILQQEGWKSFFRKARRYFRR